MKKKILSILLALSVVLSLSACTGDEVAESNEKVVESNVENSEEEILETPVPTPEVTKEPDKVEPVLTEEPVTTPEPSNEISIKEGDFISKAPMRLVNSYDKEILELNKDELSPWWASIKTNCITFPSTKEIEVDLCEEILSSKEFDEYMKDYCDIWNNENDYWSISQDNFEFHHDNFQNVIWQNQDDIHYYLVESDYFRYGEALKIDDKQILYNDKTDTLYLYLVYDYDYEDYVEITNKDLAVTLDEMTYSNRMIMALEFDHIDRLPVSEIVLVKPNGMERVSYEDNECKYAEIPSKIMSKLENEEYSNFLGNHVLSYEEYEKFCNKYGIKQLYDNKTHKYVVIVGKEKGKYKGFEVEDIFLDNVNIDISLLMPNADVESSKEFGYIVVVPCYDYTSGFMIIK